MEFFPEVKEKFPIIYRDAKAIFGCIHTRNIENETLLFRLAIGFSSIYHKGNFTSLLSNVLKIKMSLGIGDDTIPDDVVESFNNKCLYLSITNGYFKAIQSFQNVLIEANKIIEGGV